MNTITVVGRLGSDPTTQAVGQNTVCKFSLADSERASKDKEYTTWYNVEVWGKQGEYVQAYIKKGDPVFVSGTLRNESYEKQDGTKGATLKIVNVTKVQNLAQRNTQDAPAPALKPASAPAPAQPQAQSSDVDDLPF